jgi:Flp pilus assembly pilin Flp
LISLELNGSHHMKLIRAFLKAETGGGGIEYAIIAAGVGLGVCLSLYETGLMLNTKLEALATALKRQNN